MAKLKIALTGGIGSGKSAVSEILKKFSYPVFDCDKIANEVTARQSVLARIKKNLPECVTGGEILTLDRKKTAETIFSDAEKLKILNSVIHPEVMKELFALMDKADGEIVFAEVQLLFENGFDKLFDKVWVVTADKDIRIERVVKRSGLTAEQVEKRIKNQFDYEKKLNNGHTLIYNGGDLESLERNVRGALGELGQKS